jgi:hypothetical protein
MRRDILIATSLQSCTSTLTFGTAEYRQKVCNARSRSHLRQRPELDCGDYNFALPLPSSAVVLDCSANPPSRPGRHQRSDSQRAGCQTRARMSVCHSEVATKSSRFRKPRQGVLLCVRNDQATIRLGSGVPSEALAQVVSHSGSFHLPNQESSKM